MATTVATTKGIVPLYITPIGTVGCIPLKTNMIIPMGGVIPPRFVTQTKSKLNQIGFIPSPWDIGKKIGSPISIMGKTSIKHPMIKKNIRVSIIKTVADIPMPVIKSVMKLVTLHQAIKRVNI